MTVRAKNQVFAIRSANHEMDLNIVSAIMSSDEWPLYTETSGPFLDGETEPVLHDPDSLDALVAALVGGSDDGIAYLGNINPDDLVATAGSETTATTSESLEQTSALLQCDLLDTKERRRAQNRASQRAFRLRKNERVQELEDKLSGMKDEKAAFEKEIEALKAQRARLAEHLTRAKDIIAALRIVCGGDRTDRKDTADVFSIGL
ncbi:hypothetical protein LTR78_009921 [Recurvomyces mirabilis]|uniref:BZIP domain-containing protein n=1 Tax=Recurvomyces mirabilis TaxID=574656 RepID=A0AAE0WI98_9PEZI|nr:hypothetical protein LTR78_009921 [Recurvomyces mirabilis]KAK5160353.1 hypothetical protein LTS14_001365 [Recurvomyces mirabilis]